jgi:hypothetical protein
MILKKQPPVVRRRVLPDGNELRSFTSLIDDPVPVRGLTDMSAQNLTDWLRWWDLKGVTAH